MSPWYRSRPTARYCAMLLLATCCLLSSPGSRFNKHEKVYYADQAVVAFVHSGLVITVNSGSVGQDGTISTNFTVSDPQGLPLDRAAAVANVLSQQGPYQHIRSRCEGEVQNTNSTRSSAATSIRHVDVVDVKLISRPPASRLRSASSSCRIRRCRR